MKNNSPEENPKEARALGRFAAVQTVAQALQNGQTLVQALQQASQQPWDGRLFSVSAIEDWFYKYRKGKFASLQSRVRTDKGRHRAMDPAAEEALLQLRREHPLLTVKALAEELLRRGILEPGAWSESTLHRRLAQAGLDRQSLKSGAGTTGGPTKAFELPLPNMLWMTDCMHGPTIAADRGPVRTFLFALIDDCSRLVTHGQFYLQERVECFLDCLRQAVQTRGLPDKLYSDNGSTFRSQHLGIVCANLGIRLLHAKPYHAWSKGKCERFFRTLQTQLLPTLAFQPVSSIEELNRRFWKWLETDYHQREHAALAGQSPAQRFARLGNALRILPAAAEVDRLFLMRLDRRVRKDATFSLGGVFWEVAPHLRGQLITVHFDPIAYSRIEVWMGERYIGRAIRCDKQRNSQLPHSNEYDNHPF